MVKLASYSIYDITITTNLLFNNEELLNFTTGYFIIGDSNPCYLQAFC